MAERRRLTPQSRIRVYRQMGMQPTLTNYPFDVRKKGFHTEKKTPGNTTTRSVPIYVGDTGRKVPNPMSERTYRDMVYNTTVPVRALLQDRSPENKRLLREGLTWYERGHEALSEAGRRYGGGIERAAGVAAAISPKMPWEQNLNNAIEVLRTGDATRAIGAFHSNMEKAQRIIEGEDPSIVLSHRGMGKHMMKTGNFYKNLLNPDDPNPITIDTHAARGALGYIPTSFGTEDDVEHIQDVKLDEIGAYNTFANAYREGFRRVRSARNIRVPNQLQAVNWVFWKEQEHKLPRALRGKAE